jgi:hypothetical protein
MKIMIKYIKKGGIMKIKNLRSIFLILLLIFSCAKKPMVPATGEATFVETYSPAEVVISATGVGKNLGEAEKDARYQAVHFVLFGGTDPILQREEEKEKFNQIKDLVLNKDSVVKFISWEDDKYQRRIKLADGRLKITKLMRVNKRILSEYLVNKGVIKAVEEISEEIGTPFVMVIPQVGKEENPIKKMEESFLHRKAAQIIEAFLTARKYNVIVPDATVQINELVSALGKERGIKEDIAYLYALTIGSDIYITFTVDVTSGRYGTKKASVGVRIYETTTGRLLGTETGYSPEVATTSDQVVLESALNDCMDKVLQRMTNYWKDDIKYGLQYKVVVNFPKGISSERLEKMQFALLDMIKEGVNKSKENIVSERTIDLIIWAKRDKYPEARAIYSYLKERFSNAFPGWTISKMVLNRKLLVCEVKK